MKKKLSMILVLALCLTAVAAFAASPSKTVGLINVFVDGHKINEEPGNAALAAANAELVKIVQQGPAAYFGVEVNEVFEFSPVKVTIPANAKVEDGKVEATFGADTKFTPGEALLLLLGDGTTWTRYDGVANDAGEVVATVDVEVLEKADFCAIGK